MIMTIVEEYLPPKNLAHADLQDIYQEMLDAGLADEEIDPELVMNELLRLQEIALERYVALSDAERRADWNSAVSYWRDRESL